MKIDIFNISDFVKANNCPEVKNPIFWNFDGTPTTDGLFSYELFGVSDEERKNIFGYIDLKGEYIHPIIYLMLIKKSGSLGEIVTGKKYAVIANKKIKIVPEDFEGASTGIKFIYDNFEYIDWINETDEEEIDSLDKKTRLKFLKSLKKNEFFVNKWLVIPPFYRAESSTNRSMGDSINKLYKELISRVSGMSLGFSFNIFGEETRIRIQNILKDLYLSCLTPISGKSLILEKGKTEGTLVGVSKNSMIRKHLLGKTIDWAASSVITSPENSGANTIDRKPVPFGYGKFPIASLISMFQPFYVEKCSEILTSYLDEFQYNFSNQIAKIDMTQASAESVEKMLSRFIKSPQDRFEPVSFKFTRKNGSEAEFAIPFFEYYSKEDAEKKKNGFKRPLTITDLLFIVSEDILSDKHVLVTRFPIANAQNIYPCRIKIASTAKTRELWYSFFANTDLVFYHPEYPTIESDNNLDTQFYDVMICGNAYLESLGGDYDGDMLYLRGIFSQEANAEIEDRIFAKTNVLNAKGEPSRGLKNIGKDCILGLYEITKDYN